MRGDTALWEQTVFGLGSGSKMPLRKGTRRLYRLLMKPISLDLILYEAVQSSQPSVHHGSKQAWKGHAYLYDQALASYDDAHWRVH